MEIRGEQETLLLRLLSAAGNRSRTIANNIANQNTPGYQRQTVRFEELLSQSLQEGTQDWRVLEPLTETDTETAGRVDGNNVNLELEMHARRENRVLTETYLTLLQGHFDLLQVAITGRGR